MIKQRRGWKTLWRFHTDSWNVSAAWKHVCAEKQHTCAEKQHNDSFLVWFTGGSQLLLLEACKKLFLMMLSKWAKAPTGLWNRNKICLSQTIGAKWFSGRLACIHACRESFQDTWICSWKWFVMLCSKIEWSWKWLKNEEAMSTHILMWSVHNTRKFALLSAELLTLQELHAFRQHKILCLEKFYWRWSTWRPIHLCHIVVLTSQTGALLKAEGAQREDLCQNQQLNQIVSNFALKCDFWQLWCLVFWKPKLNHFDNWWCASAVVVTNTKLKNTLSPVNQFWAETWFDWKLMPGVAVRLWMININNLINCWWC